MSNTSISKSELVPFAFKNGKVRIKTNEPKLDKDGRPVLTNGSLTYLWKNKRTDDNKPIYDSRVIFVTFVPEDGKVIPPALSKKHMSKLISHAKKSGMDFIYEEGSYTLQREFEPQIETDSDDNSITTITAKYMPVFKSQCTPMGSW
tara:strand:+ start:580 stop:1020 length:441 start_codon:yes stop_codon:yes gene_type:complete